MALVHLLLELRKEWPELEMALAHFNHGLRASAREDEKFVKKLAEDLGLEIFVGRANVREYARKNRLNLEEAGRLKRYEFLEKTAEEWGADFILTAHTMTDQAETVLMRIFRGTGVEGLQGIRLRKGKIIRPLLGLKRNEIESYLREKNVEYRVDETNLDTSLLRNRIRLELIPLLEKDYDPEAVGHLSQLAFLAGAENEALEELVDGLWPMVTEGGGYGTGFSGLQKEGKEESGNHYLLSEDRINGGLDEETGDKAGDEKRKQDEKASSEIIFPREEQEAAEEKLKIAKRSALAPDLKLNLEVVRELPEALARRLVRRFLRLVLGLESPGFDQTEAVLRLGHGQKFSWGKDKVLVNERGWLRRMEPGTGEAGFSMRWDGEKELYLGEGLVFSGRLVKKEELTGFDYDDRVRCYLDAGKLEFPLEVRHRKPGDKYQPLGLKGQKRLKELFQEKKIPVSERAHLPVFLSGGKIIWVPGLPVAEEFKVTETTRAVFIIEKQ